MIDHSVSMTDDELLINTNATEYRGTDLFRYGDSYGSILELYTDCMTGEVFSVICVCDSHMMEMDLELPDLSELTPLDGIYYYEEDNPLPTDYSYPPFQVTYTRNSITILLSTSGAVTKYFQKGRVCWYLDNNDALLYIRVNDLTESEYTKLKSR